MLTAALLTDEIMQSLRFASPEAEAQRLSLLRGRRILMIMGGYPGKRPMYERARELGVKVVMLDGPGHWTQTAVQEGLFEQFIEVDLHPSDTLADRAYAAIQASGLQFDGIGTFWDLAGPLTALLAEALRLPGHPLLSVGFSRNKIFTREVCEEAGLPSPRYFRIKSAADLETAAVHVGFPAVLKPISGANSTDAYLIDGEHTLRQRYLQTMTEAESHLKTSGVHSDDVLTQIWANGLDMTLEEFLDGEEFDVDCLMSEGCVVYAAVTRDLPQPYLREVGSQIPPDFPQDKQAELMAFTGTVLQALDFTDGAFHVELKYTRSGPRLIEVNARIGGGPMYQLNRRVWGVDLVEQYLMTCLGLPIRPRKAPQPLTCLLTSDLPCPYSGIITHADFLRPIVGHPQVIHCHTYVEAEQAVIGPDRGVPDTLGEVMVFGPTVEAASQTMAELLSQIDLPILRSGTGDGA